MQYIHQDISFEVKTSDTTITNCKVLPKGAYIHIVFLLSNENKNLVFDGNSHEVTIKLSKQYLEKYNMPIFGAVSEIEVCHLLQQKLYELMVLDTNIACWVIKAESIILSIIYEINTKQTIAEFNCSNCGLVSENPLNQEQLENAKKYIEDNFSKKILISEIATHIGTNDCYLKKGFKVKYNQTLYDYLVMVRMQQAKTLLEVHNIKVNDVAESIGYNSVSSFSQAYKKYYGKSPSKL